MANIFTKSSLALLATCLAALLLVGCGQEVSTTAPPITGKVKVWKTMTKEEKIALIKAQPMPDDARQNELKKIEAGLD